MSSRRLTAHELIDTVVDEGTFVSWDESLDLDGLDEAYLDTLDRAAERAGTDESVLTGSARIHGHDAALIVGEFRFLAGSIGRAAAGRIVAAIRRATTERLPLIAATASGGTRMQEGTPAFVTMVDISAAVVAHKAAGLPYLVYLRHPTTGGVFASWGSLGHMTIAEPEALIGFLGPVVYETVNGQPFPEGVQLAENLVDKGIVDAVVPTDQLAGIAARALTLLSATTEGHTHPQARDASPGSPAADGEDPVWRVTPFVSRPEPTQEEVDALWSAITVTRRDDRPGVRELLRYAADDVIPLNGTGYGELDKGVMLALASFGGRSCVLVGQDRRYQVAESMGPAALREARRGMRMATELGLPLVTVIDTPGADLSPHAEEGALAGEIARSIADMTSLTVPSVSVLLGEGTGGGALAMLPARRVIASSNAWLSPLPPEGASAILYKDIDHAPLLAARQRVGAAQMLQDGLVDVIVPESPAAHEDPEGFASGIGTAITEQINGQL
ncbi:acetyl-CoA carboxyl transferase [Janibacter cremeus]|uniref:carboxyl transferase domain-containing protein n=1 Tax=Janibacter cremeus TaxID=1285192 RepID=UPI0023F884DE|nr:carboxyl transferase domain-containing protein [Janibacter cremeus]WEV78621.1 acetyl-CoA carboxyl transferase [Janibacter cremeus]